MHRKTLVKSCGTAAAGISPRFFQLLRVPDPAAREQNRHPVTWGSVIQ